MPLAHLAVEIAQEVLATYRTMPRVCVRGPAALWEADATLVP